MLRDGWIYVSTARATFALIVRDGIIVDGPPYARNWAIGYEADEIMTKIGKFGVIMEWVDE